ncbi:chemotaxis protein CheW [Marispirochaeta aestuarii]|uniref:chemotaxis protein CheW n=1 Tax=Marispirochaeta aestuarii TaxID=1963862 RepID=UPI0029C88B13|nr:chemotaxis protein CheW [Marispirochaeta aestuarii]
MSSRIDQQYLSFSLGTENYALSISSVREVLELSRLSKMPASVPYFKGIIDVRGKGIPVIDMGMRLGLEECVSRENKAVVVVEQQLTTGEVLSIGLLADSVHEVIWIREEDIDPAPSIGNSMAWNFINGVGKIEDGFIFILNLEKLLSEIEAPVIPGEDISGINSEELPE